MFARYSKASLPLALIFFAVLFFHNNLAAEPACRDSLWGDLEAPISQLQSRANVFAKTWQTSVVNSVLWLSAVQMLKYMYMPESSRQYFTDALLVVVPLDVGLSMLSHYLALAKISWLERLRASEQQEFWSRVAFNTGFSTLGILGSWQLAGLFGIDIPLNAETVFAAFSLSLGVYTAMQWIKPSLFANLPRLSHRATESELKAILGPKLTELRKKILEQLPHTPFNSREFREIFLKNLEWRIALESWSLKLASVTELHPKSHAIPINKEGAILSEESLAREYIALEKLMKLMPSLNKDQRKLLHLNGLSEEQSIAILQSLLRYRAREKASLIATSFIDQSLWVGGAGGVLLYSTTHWAIHRELPLFLQSLLN